MTEWLWLVPGLGFLAVAAHCFAGRGLRLPGGLPRFLGAVILGWAWATLGVEALGSFGILRPIPLTLWSVLGLILAAPLAALPGPMPKAAALARQPWEWSVIVSLGLVFLVFLRYATPSLLLPVKVVSDGPIYHLYLAARWWKAGRVFLIATPFGEVGATYFWANGEAWFAWLMTLEGGDRLARIGQVPFLLVTMICSLALARRLGASSASSLIASSWFVTVAPLMVFGSEPNVDAQFTAGYLLATYFMLRHFLRDDSITSLVLGSLAAGLAWGTKPTGIVFVPVLLTIAAALVLLRKEPLASRLRQLLVLLVMPCVGMGFWAVRNAVATGNPFYPLHLSLAGRVIFQGWFTPDVMQFSPYYIPRSDWRSLVDILVVVLDARLVPMWLAAVAGAWMIGRRDRSVPLRWVWGLTGLAFGIIALYWIVIPYRTQQRFMLPGVGLAVVPLALTLDRGRWLRWVSVGLLTLHVFTPQPWPFSEIDKQIPWDLSPVSLNGFPALITVPTTWAMWDSLLSEPGGIVQACMMVIWGLAAIAVAWTWSRWVVVRSVRQGVVSSLLTIAVAAFTGWAFIAGSSGSPYPPFRDYLAGWTELEIRSGSKGARVAYAGTNIPYYLMGGRLRNEVYYININANRYWLMHDYHRIAGTKGWPELWPNPYPGWDRIESNYEAWLDNLRAEKIDLLVVTRVNAEEGAHLVADAEGFPTERVWAEAHPEVFKPLYGVNPPDARFRLFQVVSDKNRNLRRSTP